MSIIVRNNGLFQPLYDLPKGTHTVVCVGGRGGGKTYQVSKFIAFQTTVNKCRTVILRDEKSLIKESILNEVWARYDTANVNGILDQFYIKNETELKDKKTGETLLYTKGFRASDNQKRANLKGAAGISLAVLEEAEDIRDEEKFNTFADSLRKEGCVIIIMLNTADLQHWITKRYFNTSQVEDGYYDIHPKNIPGVIVIKANFTDNDYLPDHIISNYNGYGDPNHHLYNYHYYMTAIKGYASTGRKGQILTKVKPISLDEYLKLPYKEQYGQDFGTASPAGLIGCKFYQNTCWAREINYKPMDVLSLGKLYSTLKFNPNDKIVCDYAEPNSINKLANGWHDLPSDDYMKYPELKRGFFAVPCPTKDISAGITLMSGMNLFACEESTNLWSEINNYIYAQDKYKNYTDEPIDDYNHLLDAWRYVISDQQRGDYGIQRTN
jgi:phage terminase large subunit